MRLIHRNDAWARMVGGIVALLITVIIGVMVYATISTSSPEFTASQTEAFTGYSAIDNATAWTVTIAYLPTGSSGINVTCYNSTGKTESYPSFTLTDKTISVGAGAASEFSQVNVSYTSMVGNTVENTVTPMSSTVFNLLPIIALVAVAGVILAVILGFGGKSGKT